jgi:DNA-binding MarR family transcriptional regulator
MAELGDLIEKLSLSMDLHESRVIAESEFASLSTKQIHYLDVIGHLDSPTPGALAKAFGVTKPSVTAIIDKLQSLGYIDKIASNDDRRSARLVLTEKGKKIATLHDEVHKGYADLLKRRLTGEEVRELIRLLDKTLGE